MGNYFIRIEDAPDLRRRILESSKASVHMLRGYQELLRIRGEKVSHMHVLRRELKDLTLLLNRMEEFIPHLSDAELAQMHPAPPHEVTSVPQKKSVVKQKKPQKVAPVPLPSLQEKKVFLGVLGHNVRAPASMPQLPSQLPELGTVGGGSKKKSSKEFLEEQLLAIDRKMQGL